MAIIRSEIFKSLELGHVAETPVLKLCSILERSILKNEKLLLSGGKYDPVTIFHGSKAPNMSVTQYMDRIFKYSNCSPSCFLIAHIYMERYYSNAYFAKVGGVSTEEMNRMEIEFLFNLEFKLFVTTELFLKYCEKLDRAV
ncbi:hypothetical protein V8G54_032217 [Vigna mungo]|uniref:Cyclin n=1 Tax=Vigna mungo TaxID=3915 RepID=A0AAQ3MKQ6_VIGMU